LSKALEKIFILHADHEQNASTSTVRLAGSSEANPFACISEENIGTDTVFLRIIRIQLLILLAQLTWRMPIKATTVLNQEKYQMI
jgi:hypothetical protein